MIVWPGLRRSVSAIRRLFNSASFDAPLTHSAIPTRAASGTTATFTRATTKTWQNNDGYLVTGLAGEIGFPGARRVDNLIRLGAAQSSTLAVAANITMTLPAGAYQFSMGAGTGTATFSGTGGATGTLAASASARTFVAKTISAGTLIVTASVATLVDIQVVSMVAETDQTTPREYVSVGALDYRSANNQLYLSLPGSVSHVANSPNATANQITGDIAGVVSVALADWTPAAINTLLCKDNYGVAGSGAFSFFQNTDGKPHLVIDLGGSRVEPACTAAVTFTDTNQGILGFSRVAATGVTKFWNYANGAWAQLGTDVASTAGSLNNPAIPIGVGASSTSGAVLPANGKFYSAQLYNGIPPIFGGSGSATPVVDFNPHRDAVTPTGTFTSSTTGEVWTINGASSVVRSDYYHGSFVDGVKCFPTDISGNAIPSTTLLGYSAEGARTNYALWNRDLTNVAWTKTSCTAALTATGADNAANSASTLTATAGNATCLQSITRVSAQRVTGCKIKRRTGTGTINMTQDNGVTWTPVTVTSAYTNVAIPAATAANPIIGFQIVTNGDAIDVDFVMHEEAAFVSSSIATTTIAVARNADVLTYSGGDIPNLKTLTATFRRESGVSAAGEVLALSDNTLNNTVVIQMDNATLVRSYGVAGGVTQWNQTASNSYTAGSDSKVAVTFATNDVKSSFAGTSMTADTSATVPVVTRLEVGMVTSLFQLYGNVTGIYGWTRNLSQSELNAITAL